MLKKKNNKRISPNVIAVIVTVFTLIGGFFLSYNYVQKKKIIAYEYMANIFYEKEHKKDKETTEKTAENNNNETEDEEEVVETVEPSATYDYIGYLEIPNINLNRGFVDMNSKDNDVERNLYIVEGSNYPDVDKGNFIIAAHSGNGWKAFFNDLYKLSNEDKAIIKYNNKTYTYSLKNIYKQEKKGTIAIYRNYNKTTLTLVTCTNNDKTTQTVYIFELESIV